MGQSLLPWLTTPFLLIFFLQHHFFVYSSTSFSFSSVYDNHLCPYKQRLALFQFKQTLSISIDSDASWRCEYFHNTPSYPKTNQWNMSSDCCKWDGVTCNRLTGDVIGLDLSCSQLVGVLHSNSSLFFQLPHLQRLNLAFNDFSGSMIPREFGRFATGLTHLNLSTSNFSGPVPLEISHLSKLISLDLSYNDNLILNDSNIKFQFLLQNLTQLRHISLAYVPINSVFPRNLSSFCSLTFLDLSGTGLCGEFPQEIFFLPNLKTLNLGDNPNVTGVLPQSNLSASNGSSITSLRELDLSYNTMLLSEEVTDILVSLKSLKSLKLIDCNLTGVIPKFIFNLTHLTELDLSQNSLEGQIPNENLVHLRFLSLSDNKITGPFPSWVANLSQLVYLDLSFSSLMGPLPSNITGLQKLTHLRLHGNSLNGTIPSWVFDLPLLEVLELDFNQLQGQLGEIQFKSNSLETIDLAYNEISGFVPQSIFQQVDLRELHLSHNKLSGIVEIEMFSSIKKLETLSLSNNNNLSVKLSTTNNTIINATFPNLKSLDLSFLKIKEFPYFLRVMENLESLYLCNTQIYGRVPEWVPSKWRDSLQELNLRSNFLEESIPLWICNSASLQYLDLSRNNFGGVLPHCLGNLSDNLLMLDLSMNQFHGTIPSTFANLNNLEILNLRSNFLEESIPLWICSSASLQSLDLSRNNFGGVLPHCLGNLSDSLSLLDLSMNHFYGTIPSTFANLNNLHNLNLGFNLFEESIPLWICNFTSLNSLNLSSNNFGGVLPHCLGNLSDFFSRLDLSRNHFHGTIPSTFANLSYLQFLNLQGNQFEGMVPNLGNCTYLWNIDLENNKLKDTFPRWMETLPQLLVLILRSNEFHGPISISNISKTKYPPFPSLYVMDLSNNEFRGDVPNVLGTFQFLEDLDLHDNNFYGTIPSTFAKGNFLRSLNLHGNHLQGAIPRSLANCAELKVLDLGKNQINDTFPNWLGTLSELHVLVLSFNRFHGPINTNSKNINPFPKLRIIDLSCNEFSGRLPELFFKNFKAMKYVDENKKEIEYVGDIGFYQSSVELVMKGVTIEIERILTILTAIDLSNNKFEGEIPDVIGNLKFLRQLNLSHNSLVGRIPSLLGDLLVLESLDLNSNQLVGEIPQELANLNFLEKLNLSHNQLRGRIPSGAQLNTFSNDSYYGNLALCGFSLSNCEIPQLPVLQEENDSDLMNGFTWRAVLMGYGCGTVLGFVIGYIMFLVEKPKWFTGIVERELHMNVRRP